MFALFCFAPHVAWGQAASGTISGTVADPTGAVIPNASVVLEDVATDVKFSTVSNGAGFFNFAAVAPGTYNVVVSATGFDSWSQTGIIEHLGESRTIPNIALPVGTAAEAVTVAASEAAVIPVDSGTSSTTLNSVMVDSLSVQGRNSAELVKFMPGMAMNSGLSQSEYNSQITQTNSGPIGSFSASGTQPYGSMQMTLDGAGLIDIGNMGTQIASINSDQTAEFTYLNSAFGADTPRGPNIIQVVSKSGGQGYHGDVYTYLRNWQLNANDPYLKSQVPDARRTIAHQTYPGGTFGGPVPSIMGYNKNHDKLFFFGGFEKMYQSPSATLHQLVVPTQNMINGDFSAATLPGAQTSGSNWWNTAQVPCANAANWTSFCASGGPNQNMFANGQIPSSYWDPNGVALLTYLNKTHQPNIDPATHNGYNYQFLDHPPVNRWELRARGDWNPTVNDRVSVVYTKQNEADINNFGAWWEPSWAAPMASQLRATTIANLWTANYVHTFNPTTTNELSFAKTYFTFPPKFTNSDAMSASVANYQTYAPFNVQNTNSFDQLPNLISWGAGTGGNNGSFAGLYAPAMIKDFGNAFGNIKKNMSFQDNLTKVIGRHSLKTGFFWDVNDQIQTASSGNWTQGALEFDQWGTYTTNNIYADMLIGSVQSMVQFAGAPTHDVAFHEWSFYGQDKWQATRRLTLDYGVRFSHEGQWYPVKGPGFAVFDPKLYDNTANATPWTGMTWHQKDPSIPQSGLPSKLLTPDFRGGAAYDVFGDGKSVIRGGFGIYRWQASEGDVDGALAPSLNIQSITTPSTAPAFWWKQQGYAGPGGYAQLATFGPSAGAWCALKSTCPSVSSFKKNEDKAPYTMNWNATLDQQLPAKVMFELQYIGNRTDNVPLTNNSTSNEASFSNINKIPMGGLFSVNQITRDNPYQKSCDAGYCTVPDSSSYAGYRPYANYGVLNLIQRGGYSNYNGMVMAFQKQTGPVTFLVNYTWSKVLGIRDGSTENGGAGDGPTIDPFNMRANYGPLAYDRTHLFNAAYNVNLPGLRNGNPIVRQIANGWQLSGDTQVQSGSPLQPNTNGTLNVQWTNVSNASLLGTNAPLLSPYLTCDPREGAHGAYFNDKCFKTPDIQGVNGPSVWPNIKGPAFFVSDLALFKNFKVTERQNLQFRVSAFNFLNHPLPQFGVGQDVNLHMTDINDPVYRGLNNNATTNGTVQFKAPNQNRLMELALKYYF